MIRAKKFTQTGLLDLDVIRETLTQGLDGCFSGQSVLILIPDHTRSLPLPQLFRMVVEILTDVNQLDFMIALGTHPPLSEQQILKLVGISIEERNTVFKNIGLFNHGWDDPTKMTSLGVMEDDEIRAIAGDVWHPSLPKKVDIQINQSILAYDHIIILGPTFPHEVVGFSGGAKYIFPGISGPDMINATHWLGALSGVVGTIGIKETPSRKMIHAAVERLRTPVTLIALVVEGHGLVGLVIGDMIEAWSKAADISSERHIIWVDDPYQKVLSCAPAMYDELWTAAKAMYKLEPAVAIGGEVVIYAPHLDTVSHAHGKYIYEIGYHTLPYFLDKWEQFKHIPLGVLAHSTHLRGSGVMENGIEKANVKLWLASKIPAEDCKRLNLGYMDPQNINFDSWKNREEERILYVPKAGEILYRQRTINK